MSTLVFVLSSKCVLVLRFFTAAFVLLSCRFTATLLLLYCFVTVALLLPYCCFISLNVALVPRLVLYGCMSTNKKKGIWAGHGGCVSFGGAYTNPKKIAACSNGCCCLVLCNGCLLSPLLYFFSPIQLPSCVVGTHAHMYTHTHTHTISLSIHTHTHTHTHTHMGGVQKFNIIGHVVDQPT